MKQIIYKASWQRILRKSIFPLLPFICQIVFNVWFFSEEKLEWSEIFFINTLFGFLITFPSLLIFLNYLIVARYTSITLKYNTITFQNKETVIELNNPEIDKIEIHYVKAFSEAPCSFFEFYVLYQGEKRIAFNNFTIDISELWYNTLARRINTKNIEHKYSWYPWMKKNLTNNE